MRRILTGVALLALIAGSAQAQTVADVRADLEVLDRQIRELRAELVRTGPGAGLPTAAATPLTRLDQLEAELRALTNRVDVLQNDVTRITNEATNRVGDLEFRLTELEGGDTSLLGAPEPLGGGVTPAPAPLARAATPGGPVTGGVTAGAAAGGVIPTEQADFDAAVAAAGAGDQAGAARLFETFLANWPGSPLASDAQFRRGEALAATGDHRAAARSFLDAFSGAPEGELAPPALFALAGSLARIGQVEEACLTLSEVETRYPATESAARAPGERQALNCP